MQPDLLNKHDASTQENSKQLEAVLFVSETSLNRKKLRELLDWSEDTFDKALALLTLRLEDSALELAETATGFRMQIRAQHGGLINTLWPDKEQKLSQAMLETISIIAYKQPVTRADIEQIRGVSTSSAILRQLFDKGWIVEKGFRDLPGKPSLLHTTKQFLDAFSLQSLKELPELPELKAVDELGD